MQAIAREAPAYLEMVGSDSVYTNFSIISEKILMKVLYEKMSSHDNSMPDFAQMAGTEGLSQCQIRKRVYQDTTPLRSWMETLHSSKIVIISIREYTLVGL